MAIAQKLSPVDNGPVKLAVADDLAIVTLNRPTVRNAVDEELACRLEAVVGAIEQDDSIRVAIITGAGKAAFCAGADLREVAAGRLDSTFTTHGGFAGFVDAIRTKPWIAAVNGIAVAGGFEIVLACDLVVAAETARFGLPEVKRGLIASAGGLYRLPRSVPKAIALELILTGEAIDAYRALALGLLNYVASPDEVLPTARRLASQICANAPLAVRASLGIARAAAFFEDDMLRRAGHEHQTDLQETQDYLEGSRAFLEKRSPHWTGR
jgi:enoyl-CoA hydratase/carnithine racemase